MYGRKPVGDPELPFRQPDEARGFLDEIHDENHLLTRVSGPSPDDLQDEFRSLLNFRICTAVPQLQRLALDRSLLSTCDLVTVHQRECPAELLVYIVMRFVQLKRLQVEPASLGHS